MSCVRGRGRTLTLLGRPCRETFCALQRHRWHCRLCSDYKDSHRHTGRPSGSCWCHGWGWGLGRTLDFLRRHRSQALHTLLRMPPSKGEEGSIGGVMMVAPIAAGPGDLWLWLWTSDQVGDAVYQGEGRPSRRRQARQRRGTRDDMMIYSCNGPRPSPAPGSVSQLMRW